MNLNAVRMFVHIVQSGSFSKSSEQLAIPIATLSRNISELEKSLGVQLFVRSKTGVSTTTSGQKFYEQSLAGIEQLLSAKQSLADDEATLTGQLRIATPPSFSPAWQIIADFLHAYPNVKVHCVVGDRLMDFFVDGVDVAFRMGDLHTDSVIAKKVMSIRTSLVATPAFLAKYGTPQTLSDLANLPIAMWGNGGTFEQTAQKLFVSLLPKLDLRFTSNDLDAILYAVRQHLAVGILAPYMVKEFVENGELVELFIDEPKICHDVHLIYPSARHQSAVLKAFIAFCVKNRKT